MKDASYADIMSAYLANKWPWYTRTYDLNLFGIRNSNKLSDKFDDTIGVAYRDTGLNERVFICPATTDPGAPYLVNPINKKGTAILIGGYHPKMFRLGLHKGYLALVQYRPVPVIRDNNRDTYINWELKTRDVGMHGIDLHRAHETEIVALVGRHSAGCQVTQANADLQYILSLVKLQKKYMGSDIVSYALIMEGEL